MNPVIDHPPQVIEPERHPVLAPFQWSHYVAENPGADKVQAGDLYDTEDLSEINIEVNAGIVKLPGLPPNATYAWRVWPKEGWCGDFATTKRHELLSLGWPSSKLLLAQVTTAFGEEHAVLLACDGKQWLTLDSLTDQLRDPAHTGYKWERTQSDTDPNLWMTGRPQ